MIGRIRNRAYPSDPDVEAVTTRLSYMGFIAGFHFPAALGGGAVVFGFRSSVVSRFLCGE